jgi:hypothetical protein
MASRGERDPGLEAQRGFAQERIIRGDVWRVGDDDIEGAPAERLKPRPVQEFYVPRRERARIGLRGGKRVFTDIRCADLPPGTLASERDRDGPGARSEIEDTSGVGCAEVQRALHEQLGLRTRHENRGAHRKVERPEFPGAHEVGDRFAASPALNQPLIGFPFCFAVRLVGVRLQARAAHAERVGEQHLGIELRAGRGGGERGGGALQQLTDREIRDHRPYYPRMPQRLYPPARPQSIGAVLDSAFHVLAVSWVKALPYGLLISLAGQLNNIYNLSSGRPVGRLAPLDRQWILLTLISIVIIVVSWAALLLRQRACAQGESSSVRGQFGELLQRLPALLGLVVLSLLAIAAGTACLLLPGVYLLFALSMAQCALIFERLGPVAAMKRSVQLVRGRWWSVFAIYLVATTIVFVFDILAAVVVTILVRFTGGADVALASAVARMIVIVLGALTTPFISATTLCIYGELQARHASLALMEHA